MSVTSEEIQVWRMKGGYKNMGYRENRIHTCAQCFIYNDSGVERTKVTDLRDYLFES